MRFRRCVIVGERDEVDDPTDVLIDSSWGSMFVLLFSFGMAGQGDRERDRQSIEQATQSTKWEMRAKQMFGCFNEIQLSEWLGKRSIRRAVS